MPDRKKQILQTAIEIIANEGYSSLTMRALARASNLKLGALQYHFPTTDAMLRAMVEYIAETYAASFQELSDTKATLGIRDVVLFMFDDEAGTPLLGSRLWPQLWAMQQIEPLVSDLVDDIYAQGIQILEEALTHAGVSAPRGEALCLMSLIEGSTIFVGRGRRWVRNKKAFRATLLQFVDDRYVVMAAPDVNINRAAGR